MASVKRKSSSGTGLSPYVKRLKSPTPKPRDCSFRGVAKKFKEIRKRTPVKSELSTGNKFVDKVILPRVPYVGTYINRYNQAHDVMANVARMQAAYTEACQKRK